MAEICQEMIRDCMNAFENKDVELAKKVAEG